MRNTSVLFLVGLLFLVGVGSVSVLAESSVTIQFGIQPRNEYLPAYYELIERFEELHPHIKVEVVMLENMVEKINLLYAAGQMPDVWGEGGITSTWHSWGMFLDLTEYVERDRAELDIEDFLPTAWRNVVRQGQVIGLPWNLFTTAYAYNKAHLNETGLATPPTSWTDPSWTYEQALEYARRLTLRTPEDRVVRYGFDQWLWEDYLVAWVRGFGGDFFDPASYETGFVQEVTINSPESRQAFEELVTLMYDHRVMPNPIDNYWAASPTYWEPFGSGQISTRITSGWAWQGYIDTGLIEWGLAAVPQFPAGRANLAFNDAWHIYSGTDHPDEAWELIKFLSSTEAMLLFAERTKAGPARVSAMMPYAEYLATSIGMSVAEVIDVIVGSQAEAIESMDHDIYGWNDLRSIVPQTLGQAFRFETPVNVAAEEAQRRMQLMADAWNAERLVQ